VLSIVAESYVKTVTATVPEQAYQTQIDTSTSQSVLKVYKAAVKKNFKTFSVPTNPF